MQPAGAITGLRKDASCSFARFVVKLIHEGGRMRGLKDKRVLITGGASGIGAATAARFLEEGARVCVLDRDAQGCDHIRRELPGLAEAIIADVTDLMQVEAAFAEAVRLMDG